MYIFVLCRQWVVCCAGLHAPAGVHRDGVARGQHLLRPLVPGVRPRLLRRGGALQPQPRRQQRQSTHTHTCVDCNNVPSQSYPSFWPENQKSKKYGQVFTVEYVSHNHYPNIRSAVSTLWFAVQISLLWMKRAVQCDINLNSAMFHVIYPRPRQLYSIVWVERNPFRTPSQWLCILKSRLYRKFCIFKWCGVYNFVKLGRSIEAKPLLELSAIGIGVQLYINMHNSLSCLINIVVNLWYCILWMLWIWE